MRQVRWAGLALAAAMIAAVGAVALVSASRSPAEALGGGASWAVALQLLAGLGISAAGAYLVWQGARWRSAVLLILTGVAVFFEELPLPGASGALLFTIALATGAMTGALAGSAALALPGVGRLVPDALVGGAAFVTTGLMLGVVPATLFDPRSSGCFTCPANLLLVHGDQRLAGSIENAGLTAAAVACGALALLVVVRVGRRIELLRSASAPILLGGAGVAAVAAATFVSDSGAGVLQVNATTRALWLAQCATLLAASSGVASFAFYARRLRDRVAAIVLAALPSPDQLRDTLATALGDPSLAIVFPRGPVSLDALGNEVPQAGDGVAVAEVVRRGQAIAHVRHAPWLSQSPERVTEVAVGAGLALEHAALSARLRAELAELSASRIRIVELGDAERRRLERNLHDGAQQHLIALSIALELTSPGDAATARARAEVRRALDNLRVIAHGIHPVSLTEDGVAGAVRELADTSRVPLRIVASCETRLPPSVDAALYRLVLDSVRLCEQCGDGTPVTVTIDTDTESALVRIAMPGVASAQVAGAVEHAADRIAALSGELSTRVDGSDLVVEATVPCGS